MMFQPLRRRGSRGTRASTVALGAAIGLHLFAAIAVVYLDSVWPHPVDVPVEIELSPSSPQARTGASQQTPPMPEPQALVVAAKLVPRRLPPRDPPSRVPTKDAPPPPPNQDSAAQPARNARPVFGVTIGSVVPGETEARTAFSIGNTTMTQGPATSSDDPATPYAATGTKPGFPPAPEIAAATLPRVLREVNSEDVYPASARNLGLEGSVDMSIAIDHEGKVVQVRVLRPAGHKFDEAAVEAMKRTVFSPARARDGHPIPYRISYRFVFAIRN